ncbi:MULTISPECIES: LacI family DNA-binding transcriptional regulator [Sphingobacterium]|uniref:LacI family transcriptional regulator n=1 Tax=Sphingobacterium cellulitidis TaxID=1768011 RepID=A0A8H9FZV8_9SPHI|nr:MULTISPECIES: LacI family DNA-binding transcriptional regulator [Sphingobacterium]MBA8987914.1 DNA-binding LacI/PurR family transcriptional regulator [Sphingobacterium soli]OYD41301.1 LacI family transcriptional regulator [Sphingobacterium cellulitidis]OYD45935.1 LacI family transcriptional regulator [Sphingobacterium cellulitidis]WFB62868.1 LacI family DNA-binding transcriptional regulator [Sphingobacterium sp. WM]GGE25819.1 LacI family transcriptional regulator [Sphingobacterium soli]
MAGNKPTTIKEIARKLKISPSTVSRALNDHPSIGLVTTMRVKKMAEEMEYEPNQTAIFFKQRKTFTIGVILPKLSEPFFSEAISAIENVAEDKKYTVLLGQSLDDENRELNIIQTFKKHRVDGILISMSKNTGDTDFFELLAKTEIPIVFFDCVPDLPHVHKVYSDLASGMIEAMAAFVDRGHRNIALINGPEGLLASKERAEAFQSALDKYGIPADASSIVNTDLTEQGNEEAMEKICSLPNRPSAVVSFNDFVTLDLIRYAKQRGIVLNQDMFFISYANYPLWKYMDNPPMGSIEQYPDKQAQKAAEILFDCIDKKEYTETPQDVVFPSKLVLK